MFHTNKSLKGKHSSFPFLCRMGEMRKFVTNEMKGMEEGDDCMLFSRIFILIHRTWRKRIQKREIEQIP